MVRRMLAHIFLAEDILVSVRIASSSIARVVVGVGQMSERGSVIAMCRPGSITYVQPTPS